MPIPAAGITPLSYFLGTMGVPDGDVVAMLADPIDPISGDYLSIERGFDPVDAAMLTAFRTERASGSAVENVGQRFRDKTHVDSQLDSFFREEVRLTSKDLVDPGDVEIEDVQVVDVGNGGVELFVKWTNVARQKSQSARLPTSGLVGALP